MRNLLRDGFMVRLIGGFVLGTMGMVAVHAATAHEPVSRPATYIAR